MPAEATVFPNPSAPGGGSFPYSFYIDNSGYLHVVYPDSVSNVPTFYIDNAGCLHAVYADS